MLVLNLDPLFNPFPEYKTQIVFNLFEFPGGERAIKLKLPKVILPNEICLITHRIKNSNDLMNTLLAKDALDHLGIKEVHLFIPYIPYARQDRICDNGEAFSLKVFANLLNSANFSKVITLDAHSDVAPALINNCVNIPNTNLVQLVLLATNCEVLISPDAGANKKINKLATQCGMITKVVKCDKIRNLKTGELSGFEVFTDDLAGKDCLIVDDICDGGGTFIGLATELKNKNVGKLHLFTTFGIYSKGIEILTKYFDGIWCSNGFSTYITDLKNQSKFNQIPINYEIYPY